eukprot:1624272-Heterocapsa_arctica.AAC.1
MEECDGVAKLAYADILRKSGRGYNNKLGHIIGTDLLNKDSANWMNECDGVAKLAYPHLFLNSTVSQQQASN